jgi:hypothetical protein
MELIFCLTMWTVASVVTAISRDMEVRGQEAGSIAAGVLWPVYLPYRLFLIMWSGEK